MAEPGSLLRPPKHLSPALPGFLPSLLPKLVFFVLFAILLPLFPSQAPDFVSQTVFHKGWELFHLLFVGIAISYGLFSRRNADADLDIDAPSKADAPQSYVAQILHGSSVFDDDEPLDNESRIQTWNNLHYPEEPVMVIGNGSSNGPGRGANDPLFLPVRSLKSQAREAKLGANDNATVFPSPIPWKSRSGRFEAKDETAASGSTNLGPSKSFSSSAGRTTPTSPSPKRLSPSPSLSPEPRAKSTEDRLKKKSSYKSMPPPAPPPPPPPFLGHAYPPISDRKAVPRSFKEELKDLSLRERRDCSQTTIGPKSSIDGSSVGRSVRTFRPSDAVHDSPEAPLSQRAQVQQSYTLPRYKSEENNQIIDKVVISSDDSDESDGDAAEHSDAEVLNPASAEEHEGNEVDKKADEFIAKFREQIRLQRIESIKRSSRQRNRRSPK